MKYKQGDRVLLTDIGKGNATRYATIIRSVDEADRCNFRTDAFWVLLLTGNAPVTILEKEIVRKLTEEEFDLVKIVLE